MVVRTPALAAGFRRGVGVVATGSAGVGAVMCAATIIGTYGIPRVAFGACDPTWDGLHDLFRQYPAIAGRLPEREHLGGSYAKLAYVLHITGLLRHWPGPYEAHERLAPAALALARRIAGQATLPHLSEAGAGVADVAAALWDELGGLSGSGWLKPSIR